MYIADSILGKYLLQIDLMVGIQYRTPIVLQMHCIIPGRYLPSAKAYEVHFLLNIEWVVEMVNIRAHLYFQERGRDSEHLLRLIPDFRRLWWRSQCIARPRRTFTLFCEKRFS